MKLIVISTVFAAFAGITSVHAADIAARPYTKAATMADPMSDWSGFYIGGDAGWAGSRQDATVTALPSPGFGAPAIPAAGLAGFGILPSAYRLNRSGFTGGIYSGYNWRVGHGIFGIEGDFSYLGGKSSDTQPLFATYNGPQLINGTSMQLTASTNWVASVRGRVGYAFDTLMIYGTGGAAFTRANYSENLAVATTVLQPNFSGASVVSGSAGFSQTKVGWAAGAGAEWMIARSWLLRIEYLHYGFGGSSGNLPIVADTCTVAANCRFAAGTSSLNIDSVRLGLSYKFGAPVVANY